MGTGAGKEGTENDGKQRGRGEEMQQAFHQNGNLTIKSTINSIKLIHLAISLYIKDLYILLWETTEQKEIVSFNFYKSHKNKREFLLPIWPP